METFVPPIDMVENREYEQKRLSAIKGLRFSEIDPEISDIVTGLSRLPHCYTLQSCVGHIIEPASKGGAVMKREPGPTPPESALYQLAYLALVIENSQPGRELQNTLAGLTCLDEAFVQWGSAKWFWYDQGQLNSYVIQVQPHRHRELDRFTMERPEAEKWLEIRALFFNSLRKKMSLT